MKNGSIRPFERPSDAWIFVDDCEAGVAMPWTHETVYQALIARGERVKKSPNNRYVTLYRQSFNCAVLYAADHSAAAPLHINKSRPDWKPEVFEKLANSVEWVSKDNKGPGKEAQNFDHFRVTNWDEFAKALGL